MICTFFGHRNVTEEIEPTLRSTLIDLIENHDVNMFYVGNQGGFDSMVRRILKELSTVYPINYSVVLAYMPERMNCFDTTEYSDTILFEGFETVPRRFAIDHRNRWMINQSDYVVTYVTHDIGSGAAKFKDMAERCGKNVINIVD